MLRELFKKEKIIKIPADIWKNKSVICFFDFYNICGLTEYINKISNNKKQFDVRNIRCNADTSDRIYKFIANNLKHTKISRLRLYTENVLANMAAMDMLNWGPKADDEVNKDEIKILLPKHKEFKKVEINDRRK